MLPSLEYNTSHQRLVIPYKQTLHHKKTAAHADDDKFHVIHLYSTVISSSAVDKVSL